MSDEKKKPVHYDSFGVDKQDEFFKVPHIVKPGSHYSQGYLLHNNTLQARRFHRPNTANVQEAKVGNFISLHILSRINQHVNAFSRFPTESRSAVAVAASGCDVEFAGSVGSDGAWLKGFLKTQGVGTDLMIVHEGQPSGRAIIQTTPDGENAIFLFPGTNNVPYPTDPPALRPYHTHLLLQNEVLLSDTVETLRAAHRQGVVSIFNPSPMLSLEELRSFPWEKLSVLVVNYGEANTLLRALSGQEMHDSDGITILGALVTLPELSGLSGVIVTLGANGAVASFIVPNGRETIRLPAAKIKVVDTTGAGDTFLGYLCGSLMRIPGSAWDLSQLKEALRTSIVAAGLSTQQPGAMSSIPLRAEVESQLTAYLN
ncbi:PfkB family carbohydrate kinase [Ceratobasidium theobromae]|uniref:PfkB family carbohydrate kinase n=1 Tax=Ceratobasidium theobromae TaxID=1582974 RepID=A0A5N5QX13_9AGAM|nr:PfkB family carbohydrate kinase [Ceratobasidium theobromae]